MSAIKHWCCGTGGRPDFEKMNKFIGRPDTRSRFDAAGWALFFIWIGIAWLAELSVGVGLLGVATITLGMQGLRKIYNVPVEGFWVFVGIGFAIAGLWQLLDIQTSLAPFVLIAAGVALFFWRVLPRKRQASSRPSPKNS